MTPEGKVKDMVKWDMRKHFPSAYRFMPMQNGMGATSVDFLYCVEGLFVAIETKALGKKPTLRQKATLEHISGAGGLTFVVDGEESVEIAIATVALAVKARR